MTTATTVSGDPELLRPSLAREHAAWRSELAAAIGPAQHVSAGPWARWNAMQYLQRAFPARVMKERRLMEAVASRMSYVDQDRLWALGAMLELLPKYLSHLVGVCHRAQEFSEAIALITTTLDRWCQAVEETLGPMPARGLPEITVADFGLRP